MVAVSVVINKDMNLTYKEKATNVKLGNAINMQAECGRGKGWGWPQNFCFL